MRLKILDWINKKLLNFNSEIMEIGVDAKLAGMEKRNPKIKTGKFHVIKRVLKLGKYKDGKPLKEEGTDSEEK